MTDQPHPGSEPAMARDSAVALRLLAAVAAEEEGDLLDIVTQIVDSGRGTETLLALAAIADRLLNTLDLLGHLDRGKRRFLESASLAQLDAIAAADDTPA